MIEQPFTFRLCNNRPRNRLNVSQPKKQTRTIRWNLTARHNPHPRRVNHFYGLQNMPICHVVDPPLLTSIKCVDPSVDIDPVLVPSNTLNGLPIFRFRNIPIKEKAIPQLGIVPIQENWRRELRALTESIIVPISEEIGITQGQLQTLIEYHPYPICRPITSIIQRTFVPKMNQDFIMEREKLKTSTPKFPPIKPLSSDKFLWDESQEGDYESQVFALLGQILQTSDVDYVKTWLTVASDREKATVMGMLQSAVESKFSSEDKREIKSENLNKEENKLELPGESEERTENLDRLIIDSYFDKRASTCLSRPKTMASKIRPQTADSSFSDNNCNNNNNNIINSKPQTAPVILRYRTAPKYRVEVLTADSIPEENAKLE